MNFEILTAQQFERDFKRLTKKYPSLKQEYPQLISLLKSNPEHGLSLGQGFYKLRISVASKGKGKSGGARVITSVFYKDKLVVLLTIYDKGEKNDITDHELKTLLKKYLGES